ncbi:stress-induced morphogen [Synechococcus sp. PCC 7502]|uniref:BolA family protein n=1 Tax=Synechococcus sp. PCC 7502 TaxID=1173263 RepID=UPI00029FF648|nr:BolA family protein [Synechococcus sp. PCC 7502]AFY73084.1 stress-induced morphogen [Synechococcus sp. PCC 7502]
MNTETTDSIDLISAIQATLTAKLEAEFVQITNQSDRHKHHKHRPEGSGHYDAIIVSPLFAGKSLMQQHRLVYESLALEMQTSIHALSLSTFTPKQWADRQNSDNPTIP